MSEGRVVMRVMGLDPGTQRTGYGVVAVENDQPMRCASGLIQLGRGPLAERLAHLHRELERLLEAHRPEVCAVEGLFHHRNARSALMLGHARGVCMQIAAAFGLEVVEYPPARVKQALTGNGAAAKEQVGAMVARLLGTEGEASLDASDALALALCHLEAGRPLRVLE